MFSMLVRPFITRPLRRLFSEDTTIRSEDTFNGKIILVDLPVQEYRLAGRMAAMAWKWCFQLAVMRRHCAPGTLHPVFLWADEAQNFITERDAEYQAVARSAGGCTVYLTQQREGIRRPKVAPTATRSWPNELVLTSHFRLFHVAYDGLPTVINVDVLDANVLLPTVTKPSKRLDLGRIGS
jgi:hypothetical protein